MKKLSSRRINSLTKDWFKFRGKNFVFVTEQAKKSFTDRCLDETVYSSIYGGIFVREALAKALPLGRNIIVSMKLKSNPELLVFPKGESYTNGKTIVVSTSCFEDSEIDTGEALDVYIGLVIHEAGHVKYTDFNKYSACAKKSELHKTILNVIEDEMLERLVAERRPGFGMFLEKTKKYYFETLYLRKLKEEMASSTKAPTELNKLLNLLLRIIRYPLYLSKKDIEFFSKELSEIKELFKIFPVSTAGSVSITEEIYKILLKYISEEVTKTISKKRSGESGEGESGGSDEDDSESDSDTSESDDTDDSDEEDSGDAPDIAKDFEKLIEKSIEEGDSDETILEKVYAEAVKSFEEESKKLSKEHSLDKFFESGNAEVAESIPKDIDKILKPSDSDECSVESPIFFHKVEKDSITYMDEYRDIRKYIPAVRKMLLYNDYENKYVIKRMHNGRFDASKIVDAYQGVQDVYELQGLHKTEKMAVCLVVDLSSSMGGSRIKAAKKSAILLYESFLGIKSVDLYVYGHSADITTRNSTDIYTFIEPGHNSKFNLGNIYAKSQNRDGVAIRAIVDRVRTFTDRKVLMFYIADGNPCASGYSSMPHVKEEVLRAEKKGFDILNIAIEAHYSPDAMFKHYVKFTNMDELPRQLTAIVKTQLLKKQTHTTKISAL